MSNILKHGNAIRVGLLSADPSDAENGTIYYNTSTNKFRKYENGSFGDIAAADVLDSEFRISDNGDNTKKIAFEASGIATGTTRTVTMPDSNVNLGLISTAIQSSEKGAANGVATLDAGGLLPTAQLPPLAITSVFVVADQAARLALTAEMGDVAIQTDNSLTYILSSNDPTTNADWKVITAAGAVTSVNGQTGTVSLDTDDISEGATNKYYVVATARTDLIASSISNGDTTHAPSGDAVFDALALKSDTGHTHVAADVTDFDSAAQTATISQVITNGVTTKAPSEDAVFDALAGKSNTGHTHVAADITDFDAEALAAAVQAGAITNGVTLAPTHDAVFDALALKLANVVEDLTPELGGPLDTTSKAIVGLLRRAADVAGAADFIEEQYLHSISLTASQTNTVLASLSFAHASYNGIEVSYTIKEATTNRIRQGRLRIVTDATNISVVDDYAETDSVGVTWSAVVNGASIDVRYSSTANAKTMRADVKRFKT